MADKTVTIAQYQALMDAIRALAEAGDGAIARLKAQDLGSVMASNYNTALRGFDFLAKFVEGTAGTVSTEKSRALLAPILEELRQVAEDSSQYAKKRGSKKDKPRS